MTKISIDERTFKVGDKVGAGDVRPYLSNFLEEGALKEISDSPKPLSLSKEN